MKRNNILGVLLLLLLFPFCSHLTAQILDTANVRILLKVQYDSEGSNPPLNMVITDSISLEFKLRNFDTLVVDPEDQIELDGNAPDSLISFGRRSRSSYYLSVLYKVEKGQVELKTSCYRIYDGFLLMTEVYTTAVGLSLDEDIQQQASLYIDRIEKDMREHPDLVTYLVYEEESEPRVSSEEYSPRLPGLTAAYTMYLPLGESRDYLSTGINPRIRVHFPLSLAIGELALGWSFSANMISAEGELNSSENIFFCTGPDVNFRYPVWDRLYLYAGFSGGFCFWMVNRNGEGYQGVLLPAFIADAGAGWAFSERFHLILGADYSLYIEESLNITGISPSLGIYLNL